MKNNNTLQNNTLQKNNSFPINQLLQNDTQLIRVLDMEADRVFIIDCIKRTMPVWKDIESLKDYLPCSEDTLQEITDTILIDLDNLDSESRKTAYERYTMIAPSAAFCIRPEKTKRTDKQSCKYKLSQQTDNQILSLLISGLSEYIYTYTQAERERKRFISGREEYEVGFKQVLLYQAQEQFTCGIYAIIERKIL